MTRADWPEPLMLGGHSPAGLDFPSVKIGPDRSRSLVPAHGGDTVPARAARSRFMAPSPGLRRQLGTLQGPWMPVTPRAARQ